MTPSSEIEIANFNILPEDSPRKKSDTKDEDVTQKKDNVEICGDQVALAPGSDDHLYATDDKRQKK